MKYTKPKIQTIVADVKVRDMANDKGSCHGGHCVHCIHAYG